MPGCALGHLSGWSEPRTISGLEHHFGRRCKAYGEIAIAEDYARMPGLDAGRRDPADPFCQFGGEPLRLTQRDFVQIRRPDDDAKPPMRWEKSEAVVGKRDLRYVLLKHLRDSAARGIRNLVY